MMQWIQEFGTEYAVPAQVTALYNAGLIEDASWHNDVCPRFIRPDHTRELWCDHPDANLREMSLARFRVYRALGDDLDSYPQDLATLYEGDDITAALAAFTEESNV